MITTITFEWLGETVMPTAGEETAGRAALLMLKVMAMAPLVYAASTWGRQREQDFEPQGLAALRREEGSGSAARCCPSPSTPSGRRNCVGSHVALNGAGCRAANLCEWH